MVVGVLIKIRVCVAQTWKRSNQPVTYGNDGNQRLPSLFLHEPERIIEHGNAAALALQRREKRNVIISGYVVPRIVPIKRPYHYRAHFSCFVWLTDAYRPFAPFGKLQVNSRRSSVSTLIRTNPYARAITSATIFPFFSANTCSTWRPAESGTSPVAGVVIAIVTHAMKPREIAALFRIITVQISAPRTRRTRHPAGIWGASVTRGRLRTTPVA